MALNHMSATLRSPFGRASFSADGLARELKLPEVGEGAAALALDPRVGLEALQGQADPRDPPVKNAGEWKGDVSL